MDYPEAKIIPVNRTRSNRPLVRRDAARNRERLVAAARDVMREFGGDVRFELIAERAEVTRGTLYRNFSDRQELYEVVLEHELAAMTTAMSALPDDDPIGFLRLLAEMMMVYDRFLSVFPDQPDYKADGVSEAKINAAIAEPLSHAQKLGVLHADLTAADIQLATRMMAAHWKLDHKTDLASALKDRLALFMRGLAGPAFDPAGQR